MRKTKIVDELRAQKPILIAAVILVVAVVAYFVVNSLQKNTSNQGGATSQQTQTEPTTTTPGENVSPPSPPVITIKDNKVIGQVNNKQFSFSFPKGLEASLNSNTVGNTLIQMQDKTKSISFESGLQTFSSLADVRDSYLRGGNTSAYNSVIKKRTLLGGKHAWLLIPTVSGPNGKKIESAVFITLYAGRSYVFGTSGLSTKQFRQTFPDLAKIAHSIRFSVDKKS